MAKKKTETAAAPRKPAKKTAQKSPAQAAGGTPMVDTSLAAANAARMLRGRAKLGDRLNEPQQAKESGSFRQMKESLSKPAGVGGAGLSSALGPQKSGLPQHVSNQVFHNQTQGGVAGRVNVPRRTAG